MKRRLGEQFANDRQAYTAGKAAFVALLLSALAPATVVNSYQLLSKVMTAAVDAGMLAQSPCRGVPPPKVEHEEMRYLNPAEIAHLADKIALAYRAPVFVGAYGGLRIGELAALRRSRVDFAAGTVDVAETALRARLDSPFRAATEHRRNTAA